MRLVGPGSKVEKFENLIGEFLRHQHGGDFPLHEVKRFPPLAGADAAAPRMVVEAAGNAFSAYRRSMTPVAVPAGSKQ